MSNLSKRRVVQLQCLGSSLVVNGENLEAVPVVVSYWKVICGRLRWQSRRERSVYCEKQILSMLSYFHYEENTGEKLCIDAEVFFFLEQGFSTFVSS